MKNTPSLTISSLVVLVAIWGAQQAGVAVTEGEILTTIATLGKAVAVALVYYGRIRAGGVSWFGMKT